MVDQRFDEVYQLAADMGGAGFVFSDNLLINKKLGWKPSQPLVTGMEKTYRWVAEQVANAAQA